MYWYSHDIVSINIDREIHSIDKLFNFNIRKKNFCILYTQQKSSEFHTQYRVQFELILKN